MFSYIISLLLQIYKLDIFMAFAADAATKKFSRGRRRGTGLGVFHQHNELIRKRVWLCWLWPKMKTTSTAPQFAIICARWVRLMFISLCQLADGIRQRGEEQREREREEFAYNST